MKKTYLLILVAFCLAAGAANAQYDTVFNFSAATGLEPQFATLTLSGDTLFGFTNSGGVYDSGSVFSISSNGTKYTDIYDLRGPTGEYPTGAPVISGNMIYGMAVTGGAHDSGCIFSLHRDGSNYKDLFDFTGSNGKEAVATLTLSGTKLYGVTLLGGALSRGCIFSINTDGTGYLDMHDFIGSTGSDPYGGLTLVGNVLYGTAYLGGANDSGCVFSIHTDGSKYKDMLDFTGPNGKNPFCKLVYAGGRLYGTTGYGGLLHVGCIFSIDTAGTGYYDMHDFIMSSGEISGSSLTLSANQLSLVGMTAEGGADSLGCIFSIDTNGGGYRNLYSFNHTMGSNPQVNSLTIVGGDTLFGIAPFGGAHNGGVIFRYTDLPLSVATLKANTNPINAYPNPSNGTVTITGTQNIASKIEIYNILGEQVYSEALNQVSNENIINISEQPSGVYLYRVMSLDGNLLGEGKLVVQK